MATIKDVAARAGISYTTVSHVVNNSRPVSPGVREKVEAAIAELGYVPSGVARSLRSRATGTFGVLVPNAVNPYFAELVSGMQEAAQEQEREAREAEAGEQRASQVRTMDRSERIRTYNWPENRITDHRIGYKANNLDSVLNGDMNDLIKALQDQERAERLEAEG